MDTSGSSNSETVNTINDADPNSSSGLTVSFTAATASDEPNADASKGRIC